MLVKRLAAVAAMLVSAAVSAEVIVKNGDKISFLGDSITYFGNNYAGGYVNLVVSGLNANGIRVIKLPAGISGHKSPQMLARLEKDVIKHSPDIMLLSCGVNDVWHGRRGVELADYRKNITALVDKAQKAGIKVCIMTATMITELPNRSYNMKLAAYNDFLRKLAKEKKCMLADLNADMQKQIAEFKKTYPKFQGTLLTCDGVHMNALGDAMMATGILRAFGLNEAQIQKARAAWKGKKVNVGRVTVSADVLEKLAPIAAKKNLSITQYIEYLAAQAAAGK